MPTLHIVHSIDRNSLRELSRIAETLASGNSSGILAAIERTETMLTSLTQAVAEQRTVIDSAISLIDGLQDQVANLQPNQAAIDALAAEITDTRERLANAMLANTPVNEPVLPEPPPVEE